METDLEDMEDEEDDWMDTRWAEPGSTGTVLNPGKTTNSDGYGHKISMQEQVHSDKKVIVAPEPAAGVKDGLMTRMQLNDNKAGMEGLDKEKINQIIYEASKGSKYFENEKKREEQVQRRITEQQSRQEKITEAQLKQGMEEADKLLQELEESRDLTHTIVHIDMDAYYAAVEMRDDPSLRDKPMAVGGNSMLSTSNYLARKFGVRAAMPGFIGRKLCPDLVLVKPNFKQYSAVSQQIRQILAQYDPNFCPMSLDEAYLDITEHLKKREHLSDAQRSYLLRSCNEWDTTVCLCDLNEVLNSRTPASSTLGDRVKYESENKMESGMQNETGVKNTEHGSVESVCSECGKPFPPYTEEVFDKTVEDAVREMRSRIQQKTRLTASAGIAPNTMLAKVCSDRNKPNGQYRIQPERQEVMNFIRDLPIRKISGIGKVSETMLRALGAVKCQDLYEKRDLLYHLYSPISFHHFMRICLAIGSTTVERDGERKSMSTERTFNELSRPSDLYKKCADLCSALVEDLTEDELRGKTVGIKIKTVKFEVKTRAHTLQHHTAEFDDIFTAARELLRVEIQAVQPQPLRLRLMGVRLSNLLHQSQCEVKRQDTITGLFKKMGARSPQKTQRASSNVCHELQRSETDLPRLPSIDALVSDTKDDDTVMVEDPDAELRLERVDVRVCNLSSGSSNVTKLKPKKGDTNSKTVKLLFKPKRVDNPETISDQKEINNNTKLSPKESGGNVSKISNGVEDKITTATKGKRKTGKKKTKISTTKESCYEDLKTSTQTDGGEESSGYESSKQPEERKKIGAMNSDIHKEVNLGKISTSIDSLAGNSHEDEADSVSKDKKGEKTSCSSQESQQVQNLKLFQCPVCLKQVECKNLNYFNDHVDVCLFRQISSQEQKEQDQSVVEQPEASCSNTASHNKQENSKKDVTFVQDRNEDVKYKSVTFQNLKESHSSLDGLSVASVKFLSSGNSYKEQTESASKQKGTSASKQQVTTASQQGTCVTTSKQEGATVSKGSETSSSGPSQSPDESLPVDMEEAEFYACPICNVEKIGCSLEDFNDHVDSCLSRRAIKQILDEQKNLSPGTTKRPQSTSPSGAPPAKKKRRDSAGKMKTLDSFFKS